jgi:hypothetical protein
VEVIALHRKMDQPKPEARPSASEAPAYRSKHRRPTQRLDTPNDAQRDVHWVPSRHRGTPKMRNAGAVAFRRTPCAAPGAAVAAKGELELARLPPASADGRLAVHGRHT